MQWAGWARGAQCPGGECSPALAFPHLQGTKPLEMMLTPEQEAGEATDPALQHTAGGRCSKHSHSSGVSPAQRATPLWFQPPQSCSHQGCSEPCLSQPPSFPTVRVPILLLSLLLLHLPINPQTSSGHPKQISQHVHNPSSCIPRAERAW